MHTLPVRNVWFPVLLIVTGAALLLARLHVHWIGWPSFLWLLVAAGGGIMIYNGFAGRSRGRVFWGFIWLTAGGALILHSWDLLWLGPGVVVSGFFLALGAGLMLAYLVERREWFVLVPAAVLLLVGCAILSTELGYFEPWEVAPLVNRWWPAGLVLSGAALILNSFRRGER